jgi:hypothetical protein
MTQHRYERNVQSASQSIVDVAARGDLEDLRAHVENLLLRGGYSAPNLSFVLARALAAMDKRCEFFEVTLHDAMNNHLDYLLTLGPEKVSSEHIEGAMELYNLVDLLVKQYKSGA